MELTQKQKSSMGVLQSALKDSVTAARENGLMWTGSQEPFAPWTDVWQHFPQRPSERWPLERATIHTAVADLGTVQAVTVPSRSFVRLQLHGVGMTHAERALWHEMTTDLLTECGLSPVRQDWVCSCEVADIYPTLESLLHGSDHPDWKGAEGCSLAYCCHHWELDGDVHGEDAHLLAQFLSILLLFTRMLACLALPKWNQPTWDGWDCEPPYLLALLDHYRMHYSQPLKHDGEASWRLEVLELVERLSGPM